LFSKLQNKIIYIDEKYDGLEEGQLIFYNLRMLGGLMNLAVALEITKVDEEQKMIRLCYLKNGKSEGTVISSTHNIRSVIINRIIAIVIVWYLLIRKYRQHSRLLENGLLVLSNNVFIPLSSLNETRNFLSISELHIAKDIPFLF